MVLNIILKMVSEIKIFRRFFSWESIMLVAFEIELESMEIF
jgi:hypothetical protein